LKSTDLNRIQVTTPTCCNIQVKQHYCPVLATATGNCAETNVTYSENKYLCRHVNCLSRVLDTAAPTPVTTSDRCHVPHSGDSKGGPGWAINPPDFCLAPRLAPPVFFLIYRLSSFG